MRILKHHSISGGLEATIANGSLDVVERALDRIDLETLDRKISAETNRKGEGLWSPVRINKAFECNMSVSGWKEYKKTYFICDDYETNVLAAGMPKKGQRAFIKAAGFEPLRSNTQSDFLRAGTVVEMQLGKYPFVFYDIMVKNSILRQLGIVRSAIEIVPMKSLQAGMSSGPSYFEYVIDKFGKMAPDDLPRLPTLIIGIV